MLFVAKRGQALHILSGNDFHLFVILTDVCRNNMHLMVPICSIRPPKYYDPTCIIKPQENIHPFIKQDSYISYTHIQQRSKLQIEKCIIDNSYIEKLPNLSDEALQRICDGVVTSPHTGRWAKAQYSNWPN